MQGRIFRVRSPKPRAQPFAACQQPKAVPAVLRSDKELSGWGFRGSPSMFRRTIIALLLAAPGAAVMGQGHVDEGQQMGDWGVAQMPTGCMVEAVSPQG